MKPHDLIQLIERKGLANYSSHSRVHPLNGFNGQYYVKRDDELSFGISGSKIRKYLSLIPFLKRNGVEEVVLIGGASSNNIVGLSQLLIEEGMRPILFLCGRKPRQPSGNLLISQLLVDPESIHWFDRGSWPVINQLAEEFANKRESCCVIPEGASCAEALPGALTLALDIIENEAESGVSFDHIICDAGTGMAASALVLGNSLVGRDVHHHVVLLADDEKAFRDGCFRWKGELENFVGVKINDLSPVTTYKPTNARSFGSINAGVKKEIARLAREEGILSDPVYSAKLFAEARNMELEGNILLVHSGGALGSMVGPQPLWL